jgi:hypothetical protein
MRKLIATLLFIFLPGLLLAPGQRSVFFAQNVPVAVVPSVITFVQEIVPPSNTSPGLLVTDPFTCAAGDYLYLSVGSQATNDTFTITNTTGDTVTSVVSVKPALDTASEVFSVASCSGNTGTYTITDSGVNFMDFAILEFHGVHGVDATNTCFGGGFGAACTVTTVSANTYVVGFLETRSRGPMNLATGWTNFQSTLKNQAALQGIAQTTAGLVTWAPPNGTNGGGTTDTEIVVALK